MRKRILGLLFILFFCSGTPASAATGGCRDDRASIGPQLQAAREKLRLSELTRDRVTRQLEELKASGRTDPQMLQDYTTYLQRVQDLVDENRRIVRKIEALCAPGTGLTATSVGPGQGLPAGPAAPGEEADDVAALDRRLQDSLASFDEMLLKRINAIRAESADKMRDLAQQAAQAAGQARQHGGTTATQSSGNREGGEPGAEGSRDQKGAQGEKNTRQGENTSRGSSAGSGGTSAGSGQTTPGRETAGRQGEGQAISQPSVGAGTGATAGRTYNPDDDDIVARQLREAAEQETDSELKKKLWKEYEEYKKNTRP